MWTFTIGRFETSLIRFSVMVVDVTAPIVLAIVFVGPSPPLPFSVVPVRIIAAPLSALRPASPER